MSEQKLVSPLLDGFTLGNVMRDHNGIRCYPAMKENSDEKYIVKIISIPASQVQLDALLLTGAYKDPADAMDYFKEAADRIEEEAYLLKRLSKLEGFLSYEDLQIVPMENGKLGYEVYLLSTYKRSLERYMRRHLMTHLEAINLGLDLCQALAICRRSGHMFVDVKPSNIFISKGKEYRIGDLGFVDLNSLAFTSLPSKYSSPYSPPEARDDLKTLNKTVDTYGVGMVLYQIFNDGNLPKTSHDPADPFPAPANADYELAEIIMKAIAPNPSERWQDPMEMGQALISYMQRNAVNNTPLAPPRAILENIEPLVTMSEQDATEKPSEETEAPLPEPSTVSTEEPALVIPGDSIDEASNASSDGSGNLIFGTIEEPVVAESVTDCTDDPAVTDTTQIFELPPEEPQSVSKSDIPEESEDPEEDDDFLKLLSGELDEGFLEEEIPEEPTEEIIVQKPPRKKSWILVIVILLLLALIGGGCFYFYQNIYLQTIDELSIDGSQTELVVTVKSDMDLSQLNVLCTDTYGNVTVQTAVDGQTVFSGLLPDSLYRIELEATGFHKLIGKTAEIFTTDALTNVVTMTAVTGPEDGSALINFTVDGSDPDEWLLTCEAEGEEALYQNFTGHSVTVKGLAVGKKYTFTLGASNDTAVLGNNTLEFMSSRLVLAENLTVTAADSQTLIARWDQPEDVVIESWTARCYSDNGHEQIKEVAGNEVVFTDINSSEAYTIEVTAFGMTQPTRVSITANPITITDFTVSENPDGGLSINWSHSGGDPDGDWLLMYTLDNGSTPNVIKSSGANAVIAPRVPGATYSLELQAADSTSIFGGSYQYTCSNAESFDANGVSAEKITSYLLKTPEGDWLYDNVSKDSFVDTFTQGDSVSIALYANIAFYLPHEDIHVLYVIRDSAGNVLSEYIAEEDMDWYAIWFDGDYHAAELDIPKIPTTPGDYSISIYFNHFAVVTTTFTIAE